MVFNGFIVLANGEIWQLTHLQLIIVELVTQTTSIYLQICNKAEIHALPVKISDEDTLVGLENIKPWINIPLVDFLAALKRPCQDGVVDSVVSKEDIYPHLHMHHNSLH